MRLLLQCSAGLGHIHPVIPLARAAAAAGDEVLFATPAEGVARVEAFGFAATAVPYGDPADIGRAWANLPDRDLNTYVVADIFLRIQGRAALPAVRAAIASFGADLVISAEMGSLVAAEASGVRSGMLGITALDLADLDLDPGVRPRSTTCASRPVCPVPAGCPTTPGPLPQPDSADALGRPDKRPADAIWYRHEDAEGPVPRPSAGRAGRRPQVYATLGSMAGANDFGRPIFRPCSMRWAGSMPTCCSPSAPSTASSSAGCRTTSPSPRTRRSAEAMDCDVVVTHAGSGTTVAALARGLPLVAVPMFADQMHNADRLVAAGIGVRVDPRT